MQAGDEPLFFPTDIRMIVPANREDKRLERYDLPASVLEDAYKLKEWVKCDFATNIPGNMTAAYWAS